MSDGCTDAMRDEEPVEDHLGLEGMEYGDDGTLDSVDNEDCMA